MNIHIFQPKKIEEESFIFLPLNNRKLDLKESKIEKFFNILSMEYDNIKYGIKTNLLHKTVYEQIEKHSHKEFYVDEDFDEFVVIEKKNKENKNKNSFLISVEKIKNRLIILGEKDKTSFEAAKNIESILTDCKNNKINLKINK